MQLDYHPNMFKLDLIALLLDLKSKKVRFYWNTFDFDCNKVGSIYFFDFNFDCAKIELGLEQSQVPI